MLSNTEMILRLCLAAILGSLIGLERERLLWAAGLRTHMLVCVGSCLIVIISAYGFFNVLGSHVILDPSRIAAQVVSGIGFLGAGVILFRDDAVRGLTTAASIWIVAGIGLAAGVGLYVAAVTTTGIILVIQTVLRPLEERLKLKRTRCVLKFQVERGAVNMDVLKLAIGDRTQYIRQLIIQPSVLTNVDDVMITLVRVHRKLAYNIKDAIKKLPCMQHNSDIDIRFSSQFYSKRSD
ncbi:MAG: MgtC/SapB family protein [Legionella sp.]|nr:MgtC/SapB family protein [Legionella sp.]